MKAVKFFFLMLVCALLFLASAHLARYYQHCAGVIQRIDSALPNP